MSDDLVEWLRLQLDTCEAKNLHVLEGDNWDWFAGSESGSERALQEVEIFRKLLDEHQPEWRTVEWDHDQNGKGHALCCRRCQNAEHSTWSPPVGQAYGLPEGFVTPYVLAPCTTLRLLAAIFSDRPGFREEWRP